MVDIHLFYLFIYTFYQISINISHSRNAELGGECVHFLSDFLKFLILLESLDEINKLLTLLFLNFDGDGAGFDEEASNDFHIVFLHSTGCEGWGAEPDTSWGNGALVTND